MRYQFCWFGDTLSRTTIDRANFGSLFGLLLTMLCQPQLAVGQDLTSTNYLITTPSPVAVDDTSSTPLEVAKSLELIRQIGPEGAGFEEAQKAIKSLVNNEQATVIAVLKGMKGASPEAKNWLRSVASQIFERDRPKTGTMQDFFADRENDPDARYLVFRWLGEGDDALKQKMLDNATDDPSLPLRFLAIAKVLEKATKLNESDPNSAKKLLQTVLADSRNPEQLKSAVDALKGLDVEVDLAAQLGMFSEWYVVGPFDNTSGLGFDSKPEIEQMFLTDGAAAFSQLQTFEGKSGKVAWKAVTTDDPMGSVDLNPPLNNAKDAACYAFCKFSVTQACTADARLGTTNANKVWVNGELVTANEVYHAGSMVDQYIGQCKLNAGENWVLIKICQNAQTESWAQDWQFQFRVTDESGKPLEHQITSQIGKE